MNSKLLVLLLVACMVTSSMEWRRFRFRVRVRIPRVFRTVRTAHTIWTLGRAAAAFGKRDLEALRSQDKALAQLSDEELRELVAMTVDNLSAES